MQESLLTRRLSNVHASCSTGAAPANHLFRCRALLRAVLYFNHVAGTQQGLTSAVLRRSAKGARRPSPGSFRVCALDAAALDGMYAAATVAQHSIPTGTHRATQMLSSSHGHSVSTLYTLGDAAVSQASAVQVRGTPKVPGVTYEKCLDLASRDGLISTALWHCHVLLQAWIWRALSARTWLIPCFPPALRAACCMLEMSRS